MRAPDWGAPAADLYAAAVDMCEWAETRGAVLVVLSEHHGAEDGHLPAPLMLASAIAARTRQLAILVAAVPIPLWDPVRLAEEIDVLDLISRGLGFISQTAQSGLKEYYEAQCREHGHQPAMFQGPVAGSATTVFVADDVDEAWDELGPHLLHDARMAASYRPHDDAVASITRADSVTALRAEGADGGPYRILTPQQAADYAQPLPLHPLCGGLAPEVAWRYLQRATAE